jgi:hypothetical protein
MDGILNETTNTLHKRETGNQGLEAACGATLHLFADNLQTAAIDSTAGRPETSKCGRCFDGVGGY